MRSYFILTILWACVFLLCHFFIILLFPADIPAEYWVRELIVVKSELFRREHPRTVFLGGSGTLFGVDAKLVSQKLGVPAFNFGLHAGLRLDAVLAIGRQIAAPGVVLVLPLEQGYYRCEQLSWSDWQLRNALTWDRGAFDRLPLRERVGAVYSAGSPALSAEILFGALTRLLKPGVEAARREALAPPGVVWARFVAGRSHPAGFAYSAYNIDAYGDIEGNVGTRYLGAGVPADLPGAICAPVVAALTAFVADAKARGANVIFANASYLVGDGPARDWRKAEQAFASDIAKTGAPLLERRDRLFFPRTAFFDNYKHLNAPARRLRTLEMIANLRRLGVGAPPAPQLR